jgi:HPt (histidine-containing phosphotransfer) domain-containing protein
MQSAVSTLDPGSDWAAGATTAIDGAHLARVTFGNRGLEREVLQLFDRQAKMLIDRMRAGGMEATGPLTHALKGSALNIGARRGGQACEAVEAAAGATAAEYAQALERLSVAVDEARARIAEMLWLGD